MKFLTDFGDSAVLLPLSIAIFVWLLATRSMRSAIWWGAALAVCGVGIGILKILFFACPPAPDLGSPSGHTALSLLAYGALGVIVAGEARSRWLRWTVHVSAFLFVLTIAVSRVEVHAHSPSEVVVGFLVGGMALAVFATAYLRVPSRSGRVVPLLVATVMTIALFHGLQLTPEGPLHEFALILNIRTLACS